MTQPQAGPSHLQTSTRRWPPRLYLAVDCGGTKAAATICDGNKQVLGRGRGGPANYTDEGLQLFLNSVEAAVKDAIEDVGRNFLASSNSDIWTVKPITSGSHNRKHKERVQSDQENATSSHSLKAALQGLTPKSVPKDATLASITAAWFAIAGVDSPADVTMLSPHLARLLDLPYPSSRLIVANDTSLLASPIADRADVESGIVAIAGTGSIVMSFRKSRCGLLKVLGRVGGLGWLLGDEGSGYLVGRTAIRTVLDLADRERLTRESDSSEEGYPYSNQCSDDDEEESEEDILHARPNHDGISTSRSAIDDSLHTFSPEISTDETPQFQMDVQSLRDEPNSTKKYGNLLRDRILQEWGLSSTDELLRAVYYEEPPTIRSTDIEPDLMKEEISHDRARGSSKTSVSSEMASSGRNSPSTENAHCSLNLLPPAGSIIDEETRLRGRSPIPSLSSSLSDTSSALRSSDPRGGISRSLTEISSAISTASNPDVITRPTCDRKHRLASLTPLVFHLAFSHDDEASLDILRSQSHQLALQIKDLLRPSIHSKAYLQATSSVLCLGGALVGQLSYRNLLVEELSKIGISFAAVEYVADPATRGAEALSNVAEQRIQRSKTRS